jgi:ATP-dependent DNA ligase
VPNHWRYGVRRTALEALLAVRPPLQLTPQTSDRAVAEQWLEQYADTGVGVEGLVIKGLQQPYLPGRRDWLKPRCATQ